MPRSRKLTASSASHSTKSGAVSSARMRTRKSRKTATLDSPPYCLGIDPGLKETGLVLRRGNTVLEYALFCDKFGSTYPAYLRVRVLTTQLIQIIRTWIDSYRILQLEVGLEMPVYNRNADSYAKQIRLIQEIESFLSLENVISQIEIYLTECVPGESKMLATGYGAANKAEVFAASPFAKNKTLLEMMERDSLETLGDAWSHSLCTEGRAGVRFSL